MVLFTYLKIYKIVGNDNLKEYDTSRNDIERAVRLNEIELEESETDSELSSSEQETETVHGKFLVFANIIVL